MEKVKEKKLTLDKKIVDAIKNVYDPEIPVNIWDLGLIYKLDTDDENNVDIDMTLTAPNCPVADSLPIEVREAVKNVEGVNKVKVNLTFDPPWYADLMTEEAKLELGLL